MSGVREVRVVLRAPTPSDEAGLIALNQASEAHYRPLRPTWSAAPATMWRACWSVGPPTGQ
jgi:hypothetical protein